MYLTVHDSRHPLVDQLIKPAVMVGDFEFVPVLRVVSASRTDQASKPMTMIGIRVPELAPGHCGVVRLVGDVDQPIGAIRQITMVYP